MKCGTPVGTIPSAGAGAAVRASMAAHPGKSKAPLAAAVAVAVLLLAVAAIYGIKMLNPTNRTDKPGQGGRVTDTQGITPTGGPLLDKTGRVSGRPLSDKTLVAQPGTGQPTDIIDYLRFLKEIETQKRLLLGKQTGEFLHTMTSFQGGTLTREMSDGSEDPNEGHRRDYKAMQKSMTDINKPWQELSDRFAQHPAPKSCEKLQELYYEVLGTASGQLAKVSNLFSQGIGSDPGSALPQLSNMLSNETKNADKACDIADRELGRVCDSYHVSKDFQISMEGGGNNLLNGLSGIK
jgi:hypothetical protein